LIGAAGERSERDAYRASRSADAAIELLQRLTLDMTVLRDAAYQQRAGHDDARVLLECAERGDVELGVPPQGWLADVRGQFSGELAECVRELLAHPGVVELPQVARLSDVTFPGENLLPGAYVDGFEEAWSGIAAHWNGPGQRPGDFDRWYVEAHLLDGRDLLLTDDVGLRTMCERLRVERGFAIRAESLRDYVTRSS